MSGNIQKIPYAGNGRVETGAVQFGDDWPGLFIRGDNTVELVFLLEQSMGWLDKFNQAKLQYYIDIIKNDVTLGDFWEKYNGHGNASD